MIFCDSSLRRIFNQVIQQGDPEQVNPASIDLRLGETILREPLSFDGKWRPESLFRLKYYTLNPGEVILVSTREVVTIPIECVGVVMLKSSRSREGYTMAPAGYVDPGWQGILTLQVKNNLQFGQLRIGFEQKFFQLVLHQLDDIAAKPYQGKYQLAMGVEGSK